MGMGTFAFAPMPAPRSDVPEVTFATVAPAEARRPPLRADLLDVWAAVTDAGGAVGFVPPADRSAIATVLDAALDRVAAGHDVLGVLREGERAVAMGLLVDRGAALMRHWRTVLRVMVHPRLQGQGAGRLLLEGLHRTATGLGLEHLFLTVRGGTGTEAFYARFGYEIVGRHPDAIRVAPGDDRDEILMVARL